MHDFVDHYYVLIFLTDKDRDEVHMVLQSVGGYGSKGYGDYLDLFRRLGPQVTVNGQSIDTWDEGGDDPSKKKVQYYPSTAWPSDPSRPAVEHFQLKESAQDIWFGKKRLDKNVILVVQPY